MHQNQIKDERLKDQNDGVARLLPRRPDRARLPKLLAGFGQKL